MRARILLVLLFSVVSFSRQRLEQCLTQTIYLDQYLLKKLEGFKNCSKINYLYRSTSIAHLNWNLCKMKSIQEKWN